MDTQGQVSLKTIFDTIDLYKGAAIDGELVEIIVAPYDEDGKYDESKITLTIGLQGGFSRARDTYVFGDVEEFYKVILPQVLAYYSQEDRLGKWDVTVPELDGATTKGVAETESGNLFYLETLDKGLFDRLEKSQEEVEEKTTYKKAELTDEEKGWKAILNYAKGRLRTIDFSGYNFDDKEQSELFRLIELLAEDSLGDKKKIFVSKPEQTKENIEGLFENNELFSEHGFGTDFLDKIKKTIDISQLVKLVINEKRFNQKFDRDNPKVKSKVNFTKVQLGGLKSNYFGSKDHATVIEKLLQELQISDAYSEEEKVTFTEYCKEILGLITKSRRDKEKVEKTEVDLDAPLKGSVLDNAYVDDYDKFKEVIDLFTHGKKDEERYEIIVEPDLNDPTKIRVRISILDGVSRNDTYTFLFNDGEEFGRQFRVILDGIFKEDPHFMTVAQYENVPGEEAKVHSLKITRDNNEILIRKAPDGLAYEKTKLVKEKDGKDPIDPLDQLIAVLVEKAKEQEEVKENDLGDGVLYLDKTINVLDLSYDDIKKFIAKYDMKATAQVMEAYKQLVKKYDAKPDFLKLEKDEENIIRTKDSIEAVYSEFFAILAKKEDLTEEERKQMTMARELIYEFNLEEAKEMSKEELQGALDAIFYYHNEQSINNYAPLAVRVEAFENELKTRLEVEEKEETHEPTWFDAQLEAYKAILLTYGAEEILYKSVSALTREDANFVDNYNKYIKSQQELYNETHTKIIRGMPDDLKQSVEVAQQVLSKHYSLVASLLSDESLDNGIEAFNRLPIDTKRANPAEQLEFSAMMNEKRSRLSQSLEKNKADVKTLTLDNEIVKGAQEEAAIQSEKTNVIKGAKEEAAIQSERTNVIKGAKEEAEIQSERTNVIVGAKDQALSIVEKEKKPTNEVAEDMKAKIDTLFNGLVGAIEDKEKVNAVDTTVSFEQLAEYTKQYKISNSNGPLEIFNKETKELYTPKDEAEKRNIEFAYYWGVMVGKNDQNANETVNMDFAFGEEGKKLFDIMDVHFKESLQRDIDIDFESLERQFVDSKVPHSEEIFDSLFKTDPLRQYVTQYYKESLGMEVDKTDEFDKRMSKEYAEYRKLFDLNASRMLSETGIQRLNVLKNKKGPIEEMEKANEELYQSLFNRMASIDNIEELDEEYREKQEEYNRLLRENNTEYQDAIREFEVPEDMLIPGKENNFYDILDTIEEREGEINLSEVTRELLDYIALDKERVGGELTREQEDEIINLVQKNEPSRILEMSRLSCNSDRFIVSMELDEIQETYKNRILDELKRSNTLEATKEPVAEEVKAEEVKEEAKERVNKLNLAKEDRELADYFKLATKGRTKKLTSEEMKRIKGLMDVNKRVNTLETSKGSLSKEAYDELYATYREQLADAIKQSALIEVEAEKANAPVKEEAKEEAVVEENKAEIVPSELVGYYSLVKLFEKNAKKYSVEKENGEIKIYDSETNIEYNPTRKDEKSTIILGNHWMRSVGISNLLDNAKLYSLLSNACLESYGKEGGLDLASLKEAFIGSGIENADVCFDNLFKDDKAEEIREHVAHISDLSDYEKEHGIVPYNFENMKALTDKYDYDEERGMAVERENPEIAGPTDETALNEIKMGNHLENIFGNHKENNYDSKVFTNGFFAKLKMLVSTIKDMILNIFRVDKYKAIEVMSNVEDGNDFAERVLASEEDVNKMADYVCSKYQMENPTKDMTFAEEVAKANEAAKTEEINAKEEPKDLIVVEPVVTLTTINEPKDNMTIVNNVEEPKEVPPVEEHVEDKEVDPIENKLGDEGEVLPVAENERPDEVLPINEPLPTVEKDPIVNDLGGKEETKVGTIDEAIEELTGYMDMTYDFNETRKVPTSIRVFFSNENPSVGEVVFSTGSGSDEFTLFHQSFDQDEIKTKLLPIITSKFAELNNEITKVPAYEVQGRKKNELFYLGGESENLFQMSNATQEMLNLADTLMNNEMKNKQTSDTLVL